MRKEQKLSQALIIGSVLLLVALTGGVAQLLADSGYALWGKSLFATMLLAIGAFALWLDNGNTWGAK